MEQRITYPRAAVFLAIVLMIIVVFSMSGIITDSNSNGMLSLYEGKMRKDLLPDNNPDHWTSTELPSHLQDRHQEDPDLISHIHDHWILHPVNAPLTLNRPQIKDFSQHGQSIYFDKLFNNKTRGFYIECGALEGETLSNTLYFERERHWDGILIEANPAHFKIIPPKHRHAYLVNACLSTTRRATKIDFQVSGSVKGLTSHVNLYNHYKGYSNASIVQMQCLPLYSILAALGQPHVDLFSLDIEGAEVAVLETIPFNKVNIDVILIEVGLRQKPQNIERIANILKLMEPFGYRRLEFDVNTIDIVMSKI